MGGKRSKEDDKEDPMPQFVLNDLVGPPSLDMLPVVREELWERMKERQSLRRINQATFREELAAMMEMEEEGRGVRVGLSEPGVSN